MRCHMKSKQRKLDIIFNNSSVCKKRKNTRELAQFIVKKLLTFIVKIIIIAFAIYGITLNSVVSDIMINHSGIVSIALRKKEINNVRIGYSQQYIIDKIGIPKSEDKIIHENRNYKKDIYTNKFYTLICFYDPNDNLCGYILIGNNKDFDCSNYRADFSLFDYTISETRKKCEDEHIESILMEKSNTGERLDNSRYYFECKYQHSWQAQGAYYIGYGITDLGFIEDNYNTYGKVIDEIDKENPVINFFLVFDEGAIPNAMEFMDNYIVADCYMGLTKIEYINLSDNFKENLESFYYNKSHD